MLKYNTKMREAKQTQSHRNLDHTSKLTDIIHSVLREARFFHTCILGEGETSLGPYRLRLFEARSLLSKRGTIVMVMPCPTIGPLPLLG